MMPQRSAPHRLLSGKYRTRLSGAAFVLIALALWLPFGFKTIGLIEEWSIINRYDSGEPLLLITPETHPVHGARPLVYAPFVIAHLLTPDSFVGMNLLQCLALAAKGGLAYLLLRRLLPALPFFAFAAAVLFMVYPADAGTMTLRSVGIHTDVMLGLAAILLLVLYWETPRFWLWLAIWLAQLLTLGIYELMYPLFFLAPVLLVRRGNFTARRWLRTAALWWLLPAVLFARVMMLLARGNSYTAQMLEMGMRNSASLPLDMLQSIARMYQMHITPWFTLAARADSDPVTLGLVGGAGVLAAGIGWLHLKQRQKPTLAQTGLLIAIGAAIMLVGFASYLPTVQRNANWRAFLASSFGAALILSALFALLGSRWRMAGATLTGLFVNIAVLVLISQHRTFVTLAFQLEKLYASVLTQAPEIAPESVLVINDGFGLFNHPWLLAGSSEQLSESLSYFYRHPVHALFCFPNEANGEACSFDGTGLTHTGQGAEAAHYPYSRLVIFSTTRLAQLELLETLPPSAAGEGTARYAPQRLIDASAAVPARAAQTLVCPLETECVAPPWELTPQAAIRIEFEGLVPGTGWDRQSFAFDRLPPEALWMRANEATLWLPLLRENDLKLAFKITHVLAPDILASLTLRVNGNEIALSEQAAPAGGVIFTGSLPRALLAADWNEFRFSINRTLSPAALGSSADDRELGLLFDWFEVSPLSAPIS